MTETELPNKKKKVFCMRMLKEKKLRSKKRHVYTCFTDYTKVFDSREIWVIIILMARKFIIVQIYTGTNCPIDMIAIRHWSNTWEVVSGRGVYCPRTCLPYIRKALFTYIEALSCITMVYQTLEISDVQMTQS